jgi:hypothetical protein
LLDQHAVGSGRVFREKSFWKPENRDWYERKTAEKTFTLAGCVV